MSKRRSNRAKWYQVIDWKQAAVLIALLVIAVANGIFEGYLEPAAPAVSLDQIPAYSGSPYVVVADNVPVFTEDEAVAHAYEQYTSLDDLGRCGVASACINRSLMPTEDRGDISSVRPSGWVNHPYDFVDGQYVYNRCHLIGFQLTGENANERNLITGTRYMNVEGMLPFENMVADHVKEEDHHVLYRVTPIFAGSNLVCDGVQMESYCVECGRNEDTDDDFMFNVFCYNVQPGVEINYATGENWEAEVEYEGQVSTYVLNTSSGKFHTADCSGAKDITEENRSEMTCTRQELIDKGYDPAGCCDP